ncbi:MAG: AI-2E family transporter [Cytophagales bacterium]|nr:AI-2E family transporter [Armatimonadota bacterium]
MNNLSGTVTSLPTNGLAPAPMRPIESRVAALWNLLLRIVLTVLGLYLLWRVRAIVTTVVISLVIACGAAALVEPLCRFRIAFLRPKTQRTIATALVFVFLAVMLFGSIRLLVNPFEAEYAHLQKNWVVYRETLLDQITRAKDMYAGLPPEVQTFLQRQLSEQSLPSPAGWVAGALGTTVSWAAHIVELLLIPVLAFYFTLDARALRNEALFLVPRGQIRPTLAIIDEGGAILRDYIIAQFWLAVIAGVAVGVGLKLIGMDYALILGIFAGITRAIPVIGPLLGGIPVVLLSFVYGAQTGNNMLWAWVLVFFTSLHLIESKFVMPKFLGHRLHLHAAVIIIALLIGGEFFGLMGMFLAAPVAALARVLVMHYLILPRKRREQQERVAAEGAAERAGGASTGRILRLERAIRTSISSPISPSLITTASATAPLSPSVKD